MKKLALLMVAFCLTIQARVLVEVGDPMPALKWTDADGVTHNLEEYKDTVRVLLYNAGFCGPCKTEFSELVPKVGEFEGKPVTFLSLSLSDWDGAPVTPTFLKEWKEKFEIPFPVLAAVKGEAKNFFTQVYIPNVVITDKEGKLAYKAINPGVEVMFSKIRKILGE